MVNWLEYIYIYVFQPIYSYSKQFTIIYYLLCNNMYYFLLITNEVDKNHTK